MVGFRLHRSLSAVARSGSEKGLVQNRFEFFSGLQLYRKEVRTNSDYMICTFSILYGFVKNPALPPESLGQIGFGAVSREIVFDPGFSKRKIVSQLCLPHEISAQNCAGFEAKQKSKSSWPTARGRSGLKSGKFCTVLLGTHFYAF